MFLNIVIGNPLVHPMELIALDANDWETNEKARPISLKPAISLPYLKRPALFLLREKCGVISLLFAEISTSWIVSG